MSPRLSSGFNRQAVPQPLVNVATAFIQLQEARHDADYNRTLFFTRRKVLDLVDLANQAFQDWKHVARLPAGGHVPDRAYCLQAHAGLAAISRLELAAKLSGGLVTAESANQRKNSMGSVADKNCEKDPHVPRIPSDGSQSSRTGRRDTSGSDGHQQPGSREGDELAFLAALVEPPKGVQFLLSQPVPGKSDSSTKLPAAPTVPVFGMRLSSGMKRELERGGRHIEATLETVVKLHCRSSIELRHLRRTRFLARFLETLCETSGSVTCRDRWRN